MLRTSKKECTALVADLVEEHESSALLAAKRRDLVDKMCASQDSLKEELSRLRMGFTDTDDMRSTLAMQLNPTALLAKPTGT